MIARTRDRCVGEWSLIRRLAGTLGGLGYSGRPAGDEGKQYRAEERAKPDRVPLKGRASNLQEVTSRCAAECNSPFKIAARRLLESKSIQGRGSRSTGALFSRNKNPGKPRANLARRVDNGGILA